MKTLFPSLLIAASFLFAFESNALEVDLNRRCPSGYTDGMYIKAGHYDDGSGSYNAYKQCLKISSLGSEYDSSGRCYKGYTTGKTVNAGHFDDGGGSHYAYHRCLKNSALGKSYRSSSGCKSGYEPIRTHPGGHYEDSSGSYAAYSDCYYTGKKNGTTPKKGRTKSIGRPKVDRN